MSKAVYIGQQFGSYIIIEPINSGTFGGVFKAQHMIFGDEPIVAIKIMHSHFSSQEEHALFIQEAQLLKRLKHPYILPIIDAGIQNHTPYIITEYATGGTLQDRIKRQAGQPFPIDEAIHILTQVGEALHFAHEQHVVHRDLKPANILFNAKGDALLADFGIAAILNTLITKWLDSSGTPAYMAPEQFDGLVSVKSDQYALGCIAYELITGRRPYNLEGTNAVAAQYQHSSVQPVDPTYYNPHIPTHVKAAIGTAMAKDRNNRHRSVAAFIAAIQKTAKQWYEEGCGLYSLSQYEEALAAFEQALRLDPNFAFAHNDRGMALWSLDRYEEALAAFEQALRLDPKLALAHNNKGMALDYFNRHEEALASYEQALRLDPKLALAHNNKGMALWSLDRYEEALAAFEQALRLAPDFALARNNKRELDAAYRLRCEVLTILGIANAPKEEQDFCLNETESIARRQLKRAIPAMLTKKQLRQVDAMDAAGKNTDEIMQWIMEQLPPYDEMIGEIMLHLAKETAGIIDFNVSIDWIIARFGASRKGKRNV